MTHQGAQRVIPVAKERSCERATRSGSAGIMVAVIGMLFIGGFALGTFIFNNQDRSEYAEGKHRTADTLLGAARETLDEIFFDEPTGVEERIPLDAPRHVAYGTDPSRVGGDVLGEETENSDAIPIASGEQGQSASGSTIYGSAVQETTPASVPECIFDTVISPLRTVIINEVAWMGSVQRDGASAGQASADEWIELKNISASPVSVSGLQIVDRDGKLRIVLPEATDLPPQGLYLLERTDDASVLNQDANHIYTGALGNNGMWLRLFSGSCDLLDEVNALTGWQAGDTALRTTMERAADGTGWQTSVEPGGTPKTGNSQPQVVAAPAPISPPEPEPPPEPPLTYKITIYKDGEGSGRVVSSPEGIDCGETCSFSYPYGSAVVLTPEPNEGFSFGGWSSPCSRLGDCGLTVNGDTALAATFILPNQTVAGEGGEVAGVQSPSAQIHINEVMAGSSASVNDEFVELYNPGASLVNLTGWLVRKRTSTGNESTFVSSARLENIAIPAFGYLLIAHDGSYGGSITPDVLWPSSYNIAYTNNTLLLIAPDSSVADEVSWVEIAQDQSYARSTPGGSTFVAGVPTPQNAGGQ